MPVADLIVVYLSCGAPFGVLVFLSKHSRPSLRTVGESVLAALLWPLLAASWTHRRLLLRHKQAFRTSRNSETPSVVPHSILSEYETLTKALTYLRRGSGSPSAELFEIAGHSNPKLAAVCAERSRNALLARRQRAASDALIEDLRRNKSNIPDDLLSIAGLCDQLGDEVTSELITQIAHPHGSSLAASESVREPARMAA